MHHVWLYPLACIVAVTCSTLVVFQYQTTVKHQQFMRELEQVEVIIKKVDAPVPPYHLLPALKTARDSHIRAANNEELLVKFREVFSYAGIPWVRGATREEQLYWVRVYDELVKWLEEDIQRR